MFDALTELYTEGDLDKLRAFILHSSSWRQHDFTSYGNAQIEKQWLQSIALLGFKPLAEKQVVQGKGHSAIYFELANNDSENNRIGFFFEHNGEHIKRVNAIVDTTSLSANLPDADPLLISQFDHQLHPQSAHAEPSDLITLPEQYRDVVDQWWHIWQANQMASFGTLYDQQAVVKIAGLPESSGIEQIRNFRIKLSNQLNRSYCQLQHIIFDEQNNSFASTWCIDGDFIDNDEIKRIRIPLMSFVSLSADGVITSERIQVDWLALQKRFALNASIV